MLEHPPSFTAGGGQLFATHAHICAVICNYLQSLVCDNSFCYKTRVLQASCLILFLLRMCLCVLQSRHLACVIFRIECWTQQGQGEGMGPTYSTNTPVAIVSLVQFWTCPFATNADPHFTVCEPLVLFYNCHVSGGGLSIHGPSPFLPISNTGIL